MTDHAIRLSDLSAEGVLALRKCEAAERFTSVPGEVRSVVYLSLQASGLVEWRNGQRLTDAGRRLLGGEPISGVLSNKRQLRTALLEWRAQEEDGPRPPPRDGYAIYAHDNGVRTSIGMVNAIIWSYRRARRRFK